ncbi:hypothetical protein TNIN_212861 [Trichonephila inaurata madagascariensis]|uniref:Uncharacterized protein n=1 Tax=Trichonephila inaurata madagascariensis TaxID=2747483 RepID=A0A8X6WVT8_9ARAC|nr:hypothetical protein TNIN_212861 [Trichonephila inaurata madagascariensis]
MFNSRGRASLCIHVRRAEHKRLLTGIMKPLQCQDSFLTTNIAGGILILDKKESCDQAICVSSTVEGEGNRIDSTHSDVTGGLSIAALKRQKHHYTFQNVKHGSPV